MIFLCKLRGSLCLCGDNSRPGDHHRDTKFAQTCTGIVLAALLILASVTFLFAQNQNKRNDRPQTSDATAQRREEDKKPVDPTRYTYEFATLGCGVRCLGTI